MAADYQKVIAFSADMSSVERELSNLGSGFQKVLGKKIEQIDVSKHIGGIEDLQKKASEAHSTTTVLSKDVMDLNGNMGVLSETITISAKKTSEGVKYYKTTTSSLKNISEAINPLLGKTSSLATNFSKVNDINFKFKDSLSQVGNVSKILGQNIVQSANGLQTFGYIAQTTDGRFIQLKETISKTPTGIQNVSRSMKEVSKQFAETALKTKNLNDGTVSFTDNMKRLVSRAAMTIPVWFALRAAISTVTNVFRDGVVGVLSFDKIFQKLKRNVQTNTNGITANFDAIKERITQFALESGKSTDEVTRAIERFSTVGFDLETSMSAGINTTKAAVLLFGDAGETAEQLSRAFRVLVTDVNNSTQSSKEIAEGLALITEISKTTAPEIGELSDGLEKFAGTGKALGLSMNEVITLLSVLGTRGLKANRAGNLLRTTFLKLTGDLEKVKKTLGVDINPELDSTFVMFQKVSGAIAKLKGTKDVIPADVADAITKLFGSRSGEAILDIVNDMDMVNKEFKKFANVQGSVITFNKEFEEINKTAFQQANLMKVNFAEINKGFITALVGGDDFADSLLKINNLLKQIKGGMGTLGKEINQQFRGGLIIPTVATIKILDYIIDKRKETAALHETIVKGLHGELTDIELKNLVLKLSKIDLKSKGISEQTIKQLHKQVFKQVNDATKEAPITIQAQVEAQATELEADRAEKAEAILTSELARLKVLGASNVELLKMEGLVRKRENIEKTEVEQLKDKLELEQAINEEKKLQSRLGSNSLKLYDIAQTKGKDVARRIGEVLSGAIDYDTFADIGGEAFKVFEEEFADLAKQQKAMAYFKDEGSDINIDEELAKVPASMSDIISKIKSETRKVTDAYVPMGANLGGYIPPYTSGAGVINNEMIDRLVGLIPPPGTIDITFKEKILNSIPEPQLLNNAITEKLLSGIPANSILNNPTMQGMMKGATTMVPTFNVTVNVDNLSATSPNFAKEVKNLLTGVIASPEISKALAKTVYQDKQTNGF